MDPQYSSGDTWCGHLLPGSGGRQWDYFGAGAEARCPRWVTISVRPPIMISPERVARPRFGATVYI